MSNARLGLVVGMALGFAAAFGGPNAFAIVLFGGIVGLFTGRSLDGLDDLVAATDSLIQRAQVISGDWAARLRESRVRTVTGVRTGAAAVAQRARTGAAASRERVRAGATAAGRWQSDVRARARESAGSLNARRRSAWNAERRSAWNARLQRTWKAQRRAWNARQARAWYRRRGASAVEETRELRLDDLTSETVQLRNRPGLRLPGR